MDLELNRSRKKDLNLPIAKITTEHHFKNPISKRHLISNFTKM